MYQKALKKSKYNHQLIYQKSINSKNKETKRLKIKIISFNLPWSTHFSTRLRNKFLTLII